MDPVGQAAGFLWAVDLKPGRILPVTHFGQE